MTKRSYLEDNQDYCKCFLKNYGLMKTVTAAVVYRNGSVLLTRRGPDEKLAGFWEFPGGKVEPWESLEDSLERELHEELGVASTLGRIICESVYGYDHGEFCLIAIETVLKSDEITLSVHDRAEWVSFSDLLDYKLAPADIPIAKKIIEENT